MKTEVEQAKGHFVAAVRRIAKGPGAREKNMEMIFVAFQAAAKIFGTNIIPEAVFAPARDSSVNRYLDELADRGCFGDDTLYTGSGRGLKRSRIHWLTKTMLPPPRKNGAHAKVPPVSIVKPEEPKEEKKNSMPHVAFPVSSVDDLAAAIAAKLKRAETPRMESTPTEPKSRVPVFAFIDVPNLTKFREAQEKKFVNLNFLALKGLLFKRGEYLHTAKAFLMAPRGYNVMTVRSWGIDKMLRMTGFEPEYAFYGKDIDPLMRYEIASATCLDGLPPGSECVIVSGSGDHGYNESLKAMKEIAARRALLCRIRILVRKGCSALSLGEFVKPEELIVLDQFPVYMP